MASPLFDLYLIRFHSSLGQHPTKEELLVSLVLLDALMHAYMARDVLLQDAKDILLIWTVL